MVLTPSETRRYARHIVLKGVGGAGQQRIGAARVLVVGAGGLGGPVIAHLGAAGIGHLSIVDFDTVALSNLQRQPIFSDADLGGAKAERAAHAIHRLNPGVDVAPLVDRVDTTNADALVAGHDLVVEGSDDFATKRLLAETCARAERPLVMGALGPFDGTVTSLAPWKAREGGGTWPGFADLYPVAPDPADSPPCEIAGVLSVLPGIVGAMMANEALKWIAGYGEPLLGKLLLYSARSGETRTLAYGPTDRSAP